MILRKDSWSHSEHELITEVVVEFARQNKSALEAFEHLAIVMPNRSASAIGYQWYNVLRKKFLKSVAKVEEAKETSLVSSPSMTLDQYVKLLEAVNLTNETIELINLRIRSLI